MNKGIEADFLPRGNQRWFFLVTLIIGGNSGIGLARAGRGILM
jgi:hypothetical protein